MLRLIDLHGAGRSYAQGDASVHALQDITLGIDSGEFVAIVGKSGSGKSTLLNVLGCLDQLTQGSYILDGKDVHGLGADELAALRREHFGFVFQQYNLLSQLSAHDNVALPGMYAGIQTRARLARARELLTRVGLQDRLHHRPTELSGGQQQRVSIARALMNGGHIILADEPTGALDSASGAEMLQILRQLHEQGHTVIVVTHDMGVARHADRIIELRDGRVLSDSPSTQAARPGAPPPIRWASTRGNWLGRALHAGASAWSSLTANRLRTALSLIGISIGIAAVTSIVALSDAARQSIESKLSSLLSSRLLVTVGNPALPPGIVAKAIAPTDREALSRIAGVKGVKLERESTQTVRQAGRDAKMLVVGADASVITSRKFVLLQGRSIAGIDLDSASQVAVIDEKARDRLFGETQPALGAQILVGMAPVVVIGIVRNDGAAAFSSQSGQVFIPETTYARSVDSGQDVDRLTVLLADGAEPAQVRAAAIEALTRAHAEEDFEVTNLAAEFSKIAKVTMIMTLAFSGIAAISLVVGGVGVMNILLVSVTERTREIGVRMAIGARQADVRLQFLIESILLCCAGGFVGVVIAWLLALGINGWSEELRVSLSASAILIAFTVSTVIGLISGTVPARRAAQMSPLAALARD